MTYLANMLDFIKRSLNKIISFWSTIDVNTKSTLIALVTAFGVVFVQDYQEKKRSDDEELTTKQNKLTYFEFLIKDSMQTVESFGDHAQEVLNSLGKNPFDMVTEKLYTAHSITTIATRIDQEDFYLASVDLVPNGNIAEILLLYNQLDENFSLGKKSFEENFNILLLDRQKYEESIDELVENTELYLITTKNDKNNFVVYSKIEKLMVDTRHIIGTVSTRNDWFYQSKSMFVDKLITILNTHGDVNSKEHISNRTLLKKAQRVQRQYLNHISLAFNTGKKSRKIYQGLNSYMIKIIELAKPLRLYLSEIDRNK